MTSLRWGFEKTDAGISVAPANSFNYYFPLFKEYKYTPVGLNSKKYT